MQIVYLRSGIKKPFTFIDQMIIRACQTLGHNVITWSPGDEFDQNWDRMKCRISPQLVLAMHGERLTPSNRQLLKSITLPKAIWFTDDPYAIDKAKTIASFFDYIFTNESQAVPIYQAQCPSASIHHLPLAVSSDTYQPRKQISKKYFSDLVMVGCGFENRIRFLKASSQSLHLMKMKLVGPGWSPFSEMREVQVHPHWVSGLEANYYYCGAKMVLNLHRSHDDPHLKQNSQKIKAYTPNNRLFEIAACKSFQLIDQRPDLSSLYEIGKEVISFSGVEDFQEKSKFYLPRVRLREKIARAAYIRTRSDHSYEKRIQKILATCVM
ncbi:glycosyltransferase [Thermoactinomyces sp. DSM 45892]|uniref:CgeB family protein n=1 Tax=Thermoactinomyces sp. DSM 45892 TaxID=1882753 RepID=UPI00089C1D4C|nr:glycosyltransferase [Thermoactinomyces sp. DSM 45892]SDY99763.1 spore maturation protein CgeB [Thermoactinomyces sp. DSM 45892]